LKKCRFLSALRFPAFGKSERFRLSACSFRLRFPHARSLRTDIHSPPYYQRINIVLTQLLCFPYWRPRLSFFQVYSGKQVWGQPDLLIAFGTTASVTLRGKYFVSFADLTRSRFRKSCFH